MQYLKSTQLTAIDGGVGVWSGHNHGEESAKSYKDGRRTHVLEGWGTVKIEVWCRLATK